MTLSVGVGGCYIKCLKIDSTGSLPTCHLEPCPPDGEWMVSEDYSKPGYMGRKGKWGAAGDSHL